MIEISIVIPVYNCHEALSILFSEIEKAINEINVTYEVIFVYDGGPYCDWEVICELAKKNSNVIGIELSRNFGQHKAITAGLEKSNGEWIVVMDWIYKIIPKTLCHYTIKQLVKM